ncbi:MAG: pyruvate dehydrogenase complex dihydrolipoamide acetyltransferase [Candidatus Midichloria sp.]|uniref:Acetyltransferase component of pyruvate dehydrogenase complex n=1 Tax=Hyalomma marginatum TaxID=34627 RepID=A0A8S4C4B7_9ACAR|nr:pyruvate dehydrogenase complex dihydrolipoamide acetyltransferase [Hyalomma marginatum]CAG7598919.1 pyruvate dehydrogenase complex dihydrolipoamide acetyltransferase [Hyalomma marginatum]
MAIPILMPALSPTMTEGNLTKWLKKEGDKVSPGQIMAEIETDKAIMEMEVVDSGIIGKILVPEGTSEVKINALIAVLLEEGESPDAIQTIIDQYSSSAIQITPTAQQQEVSLISHPAPAHQKSERVFISPLAKRIAEQNNIELSSVSGSGPYGRIIKSDILKFVENREAYGEATKTMSPAASNYGRNPKEFEKSTVTGVRKVIAKRLLESKQTIPHFYVTISCELDNLLTLRKQINDSTKEINGKPIYKVSVNDLVIKATAKAMQLVPVVNSSWDNDHIIQYNNIDISVAVSTDGGLITPIIRNADQKSIVEISEEMKNLAYRARTNKLKPEEFQGGGFSISNLGMYGIDKFDAIINPPQSCIMAVGAGIEKPVVKNGKIEIATVMEITLSCDHRIIDGAVAAEFVNAFKKFIENPVLMLI